MTSTRPVLLAYDGSELATDALTWAVDEARGTGARLHVLVVDDGPTTPWSTSPPANVLAAEEKAAKVLVDLGFADATIDSRVGSVVAEVLHAAESASMVVAGTRGHGWAAGHLLGSVGQHLARHAPCPVAVVRPTERRLLLAEVVAGVSQDHPDVRLDAEAVPVAPARCLIDASRSASVLFVGSHGRDAFGGLLLGSVSQDVLLRARCTVVVVR